MSATTSPSVRALRKMIGMAMVAAALIGVGGVLVARAQDQAGAKVLGVWEGTLTFGATAPAVMEFTRHGETIKWTCRYRTGSDVLWGDAEGTVTAFSPPILEAIGVYTKHAVSRMAGTGVTLSLTLDGDHMKGTLTAEMNNLPIEVSLTRKK
jgi:hypothetical protein